VKNAQALSLGKVVRSEPWHLTFDFWQQANALIHIGSMSALAIYHSSRSEHQACAKLS
jgi:hypothetical protein